MKTTMEDNKLKLTVDITQSGVDRARSNNNVLEVIIFVILVYSPCAHFISKCLYRELLF